jgi:hypothetical protein
VPPLFIELLFFAKNAEISNFGGISKFLNLIIFWHILAILGKFCCASNGQEHACTLAEIFKIP